MVCTLFKSSYTKFFQIILVLLYGSYTLCWGQLELVSPKYNQHYSSSDIIEFIFDGRQTNKIEIEFSESETFDNIIFDTLLNSHQFSKKFNSFDL